MPFAQNKLITINEFITPQLLVDKTGSNITFNRKETGYKQCLTFSWNNYLPYRSYILSIDVSGTVKIDLDASSYSTTRDLFQVSWVASSTSLMTVWNSDTSCVGYGLEYPNSITFSKNQIRKNFDDQRSNMNIPGIQLDLTGGTVFRRVVILCASGESWPLVNGANTLYFRRTYDGGAHDSNYKRKITANCRIRIWGSF